MSPEGLVEKENKQPVRKKFVLKKRENLKLVSRQDVFWNLILGASLGGLGPELPIPCHEGIP